MLKNIQNFYLAENRPSARLWAISGQSLECWTSGQLHYLLIFNEEWFFLNNRKYEHLGADLLSDIKRGEILLRCCVNQQAWLKYLPENVLWHSVHDILIVSLSVFSKVFSTTTKFREVFRIGLTRDLRAERLKQHSSLKVFLNYKTDEILEIFQESILK